MRFLAVLTVVGLLLAVTVPAGATSLFNDEDRTTIKVRSDSADDYGYCSLTWGSAFRSTLAEGWKHVSAPFAGTNEDANPFYVVRNPMESFRFYLIAKDTYFNDGDDPEFQIDNVKLTKNGGGDLLIDDFSGTLRWSYQEHPYDPTDTEAGPPGSVAVSIVDLNDGTYEEVLNIAVTDVNARDWGDNWEMNYIDIFTCLTDNAQDSFIYLDDWSAYDNIEFDWRPTVVGSRRDYISMNARTDVIPEPVTMLGVLMAVGGAAGYLRRRRKA